MGHAVGIGADIDYPATLLEDQIVSVLHTALESTSRISSLLISIALQVCDCDLLPHGFHIDPRGRCAVGRGWVRCIYDVQQVSIFVPLFYCILISLQTSSTGVEMQNIREGLIV